LSKPISNLPACQMRVVMMVFRKIMKTKL
jgi:hypothetical protein